MLSRAMSIPFVRNRLLQRTKLPDKPEVHSLGTNSVSENTDDGVPSQPSCKMLSGQRHFSPRVAELSPLRQCFIADRCQP